MDQTLFEGRLSYPTRAYPTRDSKQTPCEALWRVKED